MRKGLIFTPPVRRRGILLPQAKTQAKTFSMFNVALAIRADYRSKLREPLGSTRHNQIAAKFLNGMPAERRLINTLSKGVMHNLYRMAQVAEMLAISRSTVYRLVNDGRLKRVYVLSSPRISEAEIERFVGCGK